MSRMRQKTQDELACPGRERSEAPIHPGAGTELFLAGLETESPATTEWLMEEVCEKGNLQRALKRVRENKGSPGVDGMTVEELPAYLKEHWPTIREALLKGTYWPMPVRRVEIPKPSGGKRKLGIPTVLDRFIQQAAQQVLQRRWDPTFSENSYGFRPGRSAHQAVAQAQKYIAEGYDWVVDFDLEKFFDQVNHDKLMGRLAKRTADKRMLKLIRSFLNAGVMENGLVSPTEEGTPQGGPLSPLLSNIVLDELDREMERRGHRFCRYADDANIYVRSERAGQRVMENVSQFIVQKLKLKVNQTKSGVARPWDRKFLGFSFTKHLGHKRKVAPESLERFKQKVRKLTRRTRGVKLEQMVKELTVYLRGWHGYFGFCETKRMLPDLDSWIRRRLRSVIWKQWKIFRKRIKALQARGVQGRDAVLTAMSSHGPWRISHSRAMQVAFPTAYFDTLGLFRLAAPVGA